MPVATMAEYNDIWLEESMVAYAKAYYARHPEQRPRTRTEYMIIPGNGTNYTYTLKYFPMEDVDVEEAIEAYYALHPDPHSMSDLYAEAYYARHPEQRRVTPSGR